MTTTTVQLSQNPQPNACIAMIVGEGDAPAPAGMTDEIGAALALVGFKGARGKVQVLPIANAAIVGGGDLAKLDETAMETIAASLYHGVKSAGFEAVSFDLRGQPAALVARAHLAVTLASYRFDKYFGAAKMEKAPTLKTVELVCDDPAAAEAAFAPLSAVRDGVLFARDLVSEPANVLYPQSYADRVKGLEATGLKVEVLGVKEMSDLGMGSLLGVGQGSAKESKLVVMQWNGAGDDSAPVAFVGQGRHLRHRRHLDQAGRGHGGHEMGHGRLGRCRRHDDRAGVAQGARQCRRHHRLVENMPDGNAQRPGDVVKAMSGTTIEVINTDAEGRLVLADALWYCQDRFKPQFMIDLATLTGAMIIALGTDYAGVFSNNDELAGRIVESSKSVSENTWRMPLPAQYEKQIDSKIADIRNIGGRPAGSITAALFLQRFVNNVPWAHMDIAPTAWTSEQRIPSVPEGATGFGVRTLDALVAKFYEK